MKRVGVLHTSLVFVNVESAITDLLAELLPDAHVAHFIDSDVLAQVGRDGGVTSASTSRMVHLAQAAEAAGCDAIFSACSSLGPAIDVARETVGVPIVKIDDAMMARAVELGSSVGVLATLPTTMAPSTALLQHHADEAGKTITIVERVVEGAFSLLMAGDRAGHDAMVTAAAQDLAREVDVIVCAQASMSALAPALQEAVNIPVLSSPRLGVSRLAALVAGLEG